jgi:N-acetylmuramoyl-L-alanine amidase
MRRGYISIVFLIILTVITVSLMGFSTYKQGKVYAFSKATLKIGASGNDVKELQGRLAYLGYFKRTVDGQFGYGTFLSLKNFQSAFGMKPDGIAGAKTKLKLWTATKAWKPAAGLYKTSSVVAKSVVPANNRLGFSQADISLMANAVHGESRGEPYEGQVAVAAVILNRVKNSNFPKTPSGVIFQPGAFTAVSDGQIYLSPNATSKRAVLDAINGWDPTGGCIYYFNPATATNKWIWGRPQIKTIGKHIFCM